MNDYTIKFLNDYLDYVIGKGIIAKKLLSQIEEPLPIETTITSIDNESLSNIDITNKKTEKLLDTLKIELTEKELSKMTKEFKTNYMLSGLVVRARITKSGVYELRYRKNGYNIAVSHKQLEMAKKKFKQALLTPYTKKPKQEIKVIEPTAYEYTKSWLEIEGSKIAGRKLTPCLPFGI